MSRTTIDLDASVLRELKRRSATEGKTLGQLASEVLARGLAEREAGSGPTFEWTSADLGTPRVDLEDKEAVRAALEIPT